MTQDPCPNCPKGAVCRTPKCGRLKARAKPPEPTREQKLTNVLSRLLDEVVTSVEYSDWPELQALVQEAHELL